MGSKFLQGLAFGAGFAVAFLVVLATGLLVVPVTFSSRPTTFIDGPPVPVPPPVATADTGPQFHELPIEEQIKQSSVIALARFELAPDGRRKAIIREFMKKQPEATIHYEIGAEYPMGSHYPADAKSHGDGMIIFFVGSPARMGLAVTYDGDRIRGLGDIPLELFRTKCQANA